ncbi:MAG: ABC transporter permease [Isosphaeraceae bacterium]
MWDQIRAWAANPILIKHVRTRLRPQTAFTSLAFVVLLCLCIAYAGYQLDLFKTGTAAGLILALQFILLLIMGSGQIGASVSGARNSGILDFHRVSPMTPAELTFGFFFGAPIREYLLFAATLPFTALCMAFGIPSFRGFVQLMLLLLVTVWTLHSLVLLNSLITKGKTPSGGMVVFVLFLFFFGGPLIGGGALSANWVENDHRLEFFGLSLPTVPVVLIYQAPLLFFVLLASTRKMESARLHALNRPQAILAMVAFATLVLGLVWRKANFDMYEVTGLYLLAVPAVLLTIIVAASQSEYTKGLYRALKFGKTRLPWWNDLSVSWLTVTILAGIVLAVGTAIHTLAVGEPSQLAAWGRAGSYPLALALTVLTVAYFGFAYQFFQLRFARRGNMYFALFLFVTWFLPNAAGWIQAIATASPGERWAGAPLFALSPCGGIAMVTQIGDESLATAVQAAAITPALLYTFVFNYLLIGARRRVMQRVFATSVKKPEDEALFELAGPVAEGV